MLFHFESEVYFNILNMHQLFIWSSLLVMVLISFVAFFFFFFEGGPVAKGGIKEMKNNNIVEHS